MNVTLKPDGGLTEAEVQRMVRVLRFLYFMRSSDILCARKAIMCNACAHTSSCAMPPAVVGRGREIRAERPKSQATRPDDGPRLSQCLAVDALEINTVLVLCGNA